MRQGPRASQQLVHELVPFRLERAGKDAVFVMQLNAESPKGQEQAVVDAVKLIREQTKITLPS